MMDADINFYARELREDLAARITKYWERNGARCHWWQWGRDPLSQNDELLIARAEWILAFIGNRK